MATTSIWRFIRQIILEMTTYILLKMAHWNNKTTVFYIIKGLETSKMYYEGNMVPLWHTLCWCLCGCQGVAVWFLTKRAFWPQNKFPQCKSIHSLGSFINILYMIT